MKASLLTGRVWKDIHAAAKNAHYKSYVAVAYFGNGGANMLPLKPGSKLVVDASEEAIRCRQTSASELLKLCNKGVEIYSCRGLHAKIFVLGTKVFIGSANVSANSEHYLQEAVYHTADRTTVRQAKDFVEELCHYPLGPERLKQLDDLPKDPIIPGQKAKPTKQQERIYVVNLSIWEDFSRGYEEPLKRARAIAQKQISPGKNFRIEEFQWHIKPAFKVGDQIIQVTEEGARKLVSAPARVLSIENFEWGNKCMICIEEQIKKKRKRLETFSNVERKRLKKNGAVNPELSLKLRKTWA